MSQQADIRQAGLLLQAAEILVEHDERLLKLERKLKVKPDFREYTVVDYAEQLGITLTPQKAITLEHRAGTLAKQKGFPIRKTTDDSGRKYPEAIMEETFAIYAGEFKNNGNLFNRREESNNE